jgi:hypothetical protein
MSWLTREPAPAPDPTCIRCSKPVTPGTAAQYAGRPVHMRCLARHTALASIEQQDRSAEARRRAAAATSRAAELVNTVRRSQTHCPVCREPFGMSRGVLFQGDKLVHAACWRAPDRPAAS